MLIALAQTIKSKVHRSDTNNKTNAIYNSID